MSTGEQSTQQEPSSVRAYSIGGFAGRYVSGWRHDVRIVDLPPEPRRLALHLIEEVRCARAAPSLGASDDALHSVHVNGRLVYQGGMPTRVPRCVVDLERLLEEWGPRLQGRSDDRSR